MVLATTPVLECNSPEKIAGAFTFLQLGEFNSRSKPSEITLPLCGSTSQGDFGPGPEFQNSCFVESLSCTAQQAAPESQKNCRYLC